MNTNLIKTWKSLVDLGVARIGCVPLNDDRLMNSMSYSVRSIFDTLIKLKNKSFYTRKEIETIFLLTKNDIDGLNSCLQVVIDDDDMSIVPLLTYYMMADIFDDLIHLMESEELYEGAKNLLEFRSFWFDKMNIKLPAKSVE